MVNDVELAWTGMEASGRAIISKYNVQERYSLLFVGPPLSFTTTEGL